MRTNEEFWTDLDMSVPSGPLAEPMRFRIDTGLRKEIDRIEAYVRGQGYRDISRSDIMRVALQSFVEGFYLAVPAAEDVSLPEERPRKGIKTRIT